MPAAATAQTLPLKLPPSDQCTGDRSFAKFRAALNDVAKREDVKALLAMSAPTRTEPGRRDAAPGGRRRTTDYLPPEDWSIIRVILRMGCTRAGSERVMPSALAQLDHVPAAELKNKLIALPGAKLLDEPREENSVTGTLEWDIVTAVSFSSDIATGVQLANGREGWVSDEDLYWLDDSVRYEITFAKRGGKWMIVHYWW